MRSPGHRSALQPIKLRFTETTKALTDQSAMRDEVAVPLVPGCSATVPSLIRNQNQFVVGEWRRVLILMTAAFAMEAAYKAGCYDDVYN